MPAPPADPSPLAQLLAVAGAGALGACARYGVGLWLPDGRIPWATLAVNLAGSFLLGLLVALSLEGELLPRAWRVPLSTGFLGAFTTFSTFSVETVRLLQAGDWRGALLNLLAQLGLGLLAAILGLASGRSLAG